MIVAQTVVLLTADVGFILLASVWHTPAGFESQRFWFLRAPRGSFVLETTVGKRGIMHIFIEVLIVGISLVAYLATQLICKMRQKKQRLRDIASNANSEAAKASPTAVNGIKERGKKMQSTEALQRIKNSKQRMYPAIERIISMVKGVESEAGALLALVLGVVGDFFYFFISLQTHVVHALFLYGVISKINVNCPIVCSFFS